MNLEFKLTEIKAVPPFIKIFQCIPVFGGNKPDILHVQRFKLVNDEWECYGYVKNGLDDNASEWGSFGISSDWGERTW